MNGIESLIAFVVFERQTIEVFGWCNFSILFNFSEIEAFASEALILGEISFLILLPLVRISDLFSQLIVKTIIFIKDSLGTKHSRLTNQSQIILYTFMTF